MDRVVETLKAERAKGTGILIITHLLPPNLDADRIVEMVPVGDGELRGDS
ncbi:MAG TPA: hypothetical protein PLA50_12955 [Bacteroidia bacterium]|nr:hypothetical protein [Bacteroidia bacterium]